ncbi:MAG TPA: alpha/beta hydrolase [Chitinophagaceae bacterium]|nr:alpha/beta hydrolase [Chitinophagaceae bacterium]
MKFRISDRKARSEFARAGVQLTTETVSIHGFRLHYVKTGKDTLPTLFFIHGSPGGWDAFSRYLKDSALLDRFRMVAIDRPGFGYSEFGSARNLEQQSVIISPLLARLANGQPAYIVGHSLGGPMALRLAIDNAGYFTGIVLLAGSLDPEEEKPEKWRPFLYKTPLKYLVPGAFRPSNQELWYLKKDLLRLREDLYQVRCAVHILHGGKDNMVPVGNAWYARRMLINASRVDVTILPEANHFIPWTHFEKIRQVLLDLHP